MIEPAQRKPIVRLYSQPILCLCMTVSSLACTIGGEERKAVGSFTVTDSSGVHIVTFASIPLLPSAAREVLEPADTVGVLASPRDSYFSQVRAAELFEEGVLIADRSLRKLALFDYQGELLDEVGGEGAGPGEFQYILWLSKIGNTTILAWDPQLRRLSEFEVAGSSIRFVDVWSVLGGARLSPIGVLNDSTIVVSSSGSRGELRPGFNAPGTFKVRIGLEGHEIAVLGQPTFYDEVGIIIHQPFTSLPFLVASGSYSWIGSGLTRELRRYRSDGQLVELLRFPPGPLVSAMDRARFIEEYLSGLTPDVREHAERVVGEIPFPDHHLPFQSIRSAESDELIIQVGHPDSPQWMIYSPEGVAELVLPPDTRPLAMSQQWVVLLHEDSLNVDWVLLAKRPQP